MSIEGSRLRDECSRGSASFTLMVQMARYRPFVPFVPFTMQVVQLGFAQL